MDDCSSHSAPIGRKRFAARLAWFPASMAASVESTALLACNLRAFALRHLGASKTPRLGASRQAIRPSSSQLPEPSRARLSVIRKRTAYARIFHLSRQASPDPAEYSVFSVTAYQHRNPGSRLAISGLRAALILPLLQIRIAGRFLSFLVCLVFVQILHQPFSKPHRQSRRSLLVDSNMQQLVPKRSRENSTRSQNRGRLQVYLRSRSARGYPARLARGITKRSNIRIDANDYARLRPTESLSHRAIQQLSLAENLPIAIRIR